MIERRRRRRYINKGSQPNMILEIQINRSLMEKESYLLELLGTITYGLTESFDKNL